MAIARLHSERPGHTLQATALVHEVYLRMCRAHEIRCENRAHFFRIAARVMRRILVDYAGNTVRGSGIQGLLSARSMTLSPSLWINLHSPLKLMNCWSSLPNLARGRHRSWEMRFYGGLTEEEIASAVGKNVRTIRRDWLMATGLVSRTAQARLDVWRAAGKFSP